jgi:O-antigen/teichoic acid export membrane protein
MRLKYILGGAAANLYGQAVTIGTQLLSVPVLIAAWGLDRFGLWTMLITVPTLLLTMDFGYSAAAAGMMSKAIARGDRDDALKSMQTALAVILVIVAAILGVAMGLHAWAHGQSFTALGGLTAEQVSVAAASAPFLLAYVAVSLISGLVNAVYRVNDHYPTGVMIFETGRLFEQALVLGVAVSGGSLVAATMAMVASRITFTSLSAITMRRVTPWARFSLSQATWRRFLELFRPALAAMFIPLCVLAGVQGVTIIVGLFLSPALAGGFASVRVLYRMVVQVVGTLTRATVPDFAHVHARGDVASTRRIAQFTVAVLLTGAIVGTLGVVTLGPPFVGIWTHGKVNLPQHIYVILAAHALFGCLWNGLSNLVTGLNRHTGYVPQLMAWNILSIGLLFLTIPRFGMDAAALAIAAIDILSFLSVFRVWLAVAPAGWWDWSLIQQLPAAAAARIGASSRR